jgi:hypothetical protein
MLIAVSALLAVNGALGVSAWKLATAPTVDIEIPAPIQPTTKPSAFVSTPLVSDAAAEDPILARPIFDPTRRPFVASPPPPPPPQAPPPPAAPVVMPLLDGVILTESTRKALIRLAGEADGSWLQVGELAGRWKVARIEPSLVELEVEGQRFELPLYPSGEPAFRFQNTDRPNGATRQRRTRVGGRRRES